MPVMVTLWSLTFLKPHSNPIPFLGRARRTPSAGALATILASRGRVRPPSPGTVSPLANALGIPLLGWLEQITLRCRSRPAGDTLAPVGLTPALGEWEAMYQQGRHRLLLSVYPEGI